MKIRKKIKTTIVDASIFDDERLSLSDIGVLVTIDLLLSCKEIDVEEIYEYSKEDEKELAEKAIQKLIEYGYISELKG